MKFVELGVIAVVAAIGILLLIYGVAVLMGWTFIHDKLRFERKQDSKEKM